MEEVFTLKGCLTHSHETGNLDSIRLPDKVRKIVVQLFHLGISVQAMREKYLRTDFFGGRIGKIPKEGIFTTLQRRNLPLPPESSVGEREMMSRYFQFKHIRTSNDNDSIICICDESQRERLRDNPKSLIVYTTHDIYKDYTLTSILVLNKAGEGVPIMQVIANDVNETAKFAIETLKDLEPDMANQLHVLMHDSLSCQPFVDAIANTLRPSVLMTLNLQLNLVESYDRILHSMLPSLASRIDNVVYALLSVNKNIERRNERMMLGMCQQNKVKAVFESMHPQDKFTVGKNDSSWVVIEGDVHHTLISNEPRLMCNPDMCQVTCSSCQRGCAHLISCSCSVYAENQVCPHQHLILELIEAPVRTNEAAVGGGVDMEEMERVLKDTEWKKPLRTKRKKKVNNEEFEQKRADTTKELASLLVYVQNCPNSAESLDILDSFSHFMQLHRVTPTPTHTKTLKSVSDKVSSIVVDVNQKSLESEVTTVTDPQTNLIPEETTSLPRVTRPLQRIVRPMILKNTSVIGQDRPVRNLIRNTQALEVNDISWLTLLASLTTEQILDKVVKDSDIQAESYLSKLARAKSVWTCMKCKRFELSSGLSGFIECVTCCHWFHTSCCQLTGLDLEEEESTLQFLCETCANLQQIVTQTQLDSDSVMKDDDTVLFIPADNPANVDFVQMIYE